MWILWRTPRDTQCSGLASYFQKINSRFFQNCLPWIYQMDSAFLEELRTTTRLPDLTSTTALQSRYIYKKIIGEAEDEYLLQIPLILLDSHNETEYVTTWIMCDVWKLWESCQLSSWNDKWRTAVSEQEGVKGGQIIPEAPLGTKMPELWVFIEKIKTKTDEKVYIGNCIFNVPAITIKRLIYPIVIIHW